jgi:iron complex transport system substrate-binding protein
MIAVRARWYLVVLIGILVVGCHRRVDSRRGAARIVSVGGALTETVFALGAGDRVVGVDTSSVFPARAPALPQVGYQRTLAAEGIASLAPDLVLVTPEAGPPAVLEQLAGAGVRVERVAADASLQGARARIVHVAQILERDPAPLLRELDADVARALAFVARAGDRPRVLVVYARGAGAAHVFGRATAADAMVALAGGENVMTAFEGSRPLTAESVVTARPDVIVIPSRGLATLGGIDALLALPGMRETPAGRARRVVAVDDLLLLTFGPRTGTAIAELARAIHPELGVR